MTESDLVAWGGAAYRLAARVLGPTGDVEDVLQEAYLAAFGELRKGAPPHDMRAWFLKVVVNTARNQVRSSINRRKREAAMPRETAHLDAVGIAPELIAALRKAMESLEERLRLPVALCCEEGLSQREAAAILEMPESTVNKYVSVGLERLRNTLTQAGYAMAPAAILAALAYTAPSAPVTLTAALQELMANGFSGKTALGAAPSADKGGLVMKIGVGVAAMGLVAGAAVWSAAGRSGEQAGQPTAAAASSQKPKFDIPVWDPAVRWEKVPRPYVASFPGELAGPRQETMWRHAWGSAPSQFPGMTQGSREVCYTYDLKTERYYPMAGSTQGWLDGPFSRARLGGADYTCRPRAVLSPDGRYGYMNDVRNGGKLRLYDFEQQEVRTLFPDQRFGGSMVVNSKGELLSIAKDGTLLTISPDGSAMKRGPKLDLQCSIGGMGDGGATLALDEARNRLYASAMDKNWYYWYWDVGDGSFHGLIPHPKPGEPSRGRPSVGAGQPGPFKGTALYGEGTALLFGPDDPGRRFLYSTRVDTSFLFRLDMEKEFFATFSVKEGRFQDSGKPDGNSCAGIASPVWLPDGSYLGADPNYRWYLFKRVK